MKYNIVKVDGFLYAVDNNRSTNKGFRYWVNGENGVGSILNFGISRGWPVIATNNPSLTDVPKLPEVKGDKYHIREATEAWKKVSKIMEDMGEKTTLEQKAWFISGYGYAKGGYSEEDMKHMYFEGILDGRAGVPDDKEAEILFKNSLKSLKPVPVAVELETEQWNIGGGLGLAHAQPLQSHIKPTVDKNGFVIVKKWYYAKEKESIDTSSEG